eukprot:TRINITY_DN5463_c0_g1_i1.p1 TRINITY_DN5463_c0_g1~~TRINITY_DN5463_c0_g1_i1.p1  ORF type:complete len:658 (-),score=75.69 TRINITY_DN5463_c0_g1_i1:666-2639(-)
MWSYLYSFVSKTDTNDSNNSANLQGGLGQILTPAPSTSALTRFRSARNSCEALQKVLEGQGKECKKICRKGARIILTQQNQEGLGLLLRKSPSQKFEEDEDETVFDEDKESAYVGKQALEAHPCNNNSQSTSTTVVSSDTTNTTSVILTQNGQFRPRRSDSRIIESLKACMQVHSTPRSARTTLSRQIKTSNDSVYSYQHKEASQKVAGVDQNTQYMKRNMSMDVSRQRYDDVAQKRQHSMEFVWQCPQGFSPEAIDLDLPPAVQKYLQDNKDILMRQQQCEELPPDFDVRSVISETRSMPDIKRSESPVARPTILYNRCKPKQSKVQKLIGNMESRGNLGQHKRQVSFVDKAANHLVSEKEPAQQYIPVNYRYNNKQESTNAAIQQQVIHRTQQQQQQSTRNKSQSQFQAENEEVEGEIWQFKDILQQAKQREEECQRQQHIQQQHVQNSPNNSLQTNYHQIKFNLEKSFSKKERRSSQNSDTSSISETRYKELLNTWKAKHREFVKRTQKSRSRRYGRQRPQSMKDQESLQTLPPARFVDLRNCLSIPEAQAMFSRLLEDDLQSVQSEPLAQRCLAQSNREVKPTSAQTYSTSKSNGSCQEVALSKSQSLLQMIEEGRQGVSVDIVVGERTVSFTGFTSLGGSSLSDGTLVQVFD